MEVKKAPKAVPPIEMYVNRLKELKQQGYKLAIRKLAVSDFENYREAVLAVPSASKSTEASKAFVKFVMENPTM